ncbi:MAG: beta-N-acetylhexosaminidase [Sphaerochaeta sp.]|uniref:beta-N-acetylhexosaminidase n=1 Tax=Sphaerochaeta sp. TaxID=1972642 RepID=UPI003D09B03E
MHIKPYRASALLVPSPKRITDTEGTFILHRGTTLSCEPQFKVIASFAREIFSCETEGDDIKILLERDLQEEAYRLSITSESIVLGASTNTGAFRALSTLRKLDLLTTHELPCCEIEDAPDYGWRGFMIDCSRHYLSIEFLKKLIDTASLFHLNRFHWHLTDDQGWRIPLEGWDRLEKIAAHRRQLQYTDGRTYGIMYTKEEILDLQAYAHQRHILIIPEIETPGHVSSLLAAYPEFGCTAGPYEVQDRWGIFDEVLCCGNDAVLDFLRDAIKQIAALFSDPYIHIGGDECPHTAWEHCPKCQQRMLEAGLSEERQLQSWMTSQICQMVHQEGKRPIGWDEVLEGTEKLGLPPDLIVMSWRGSEGGIQASKRGHQVIMSPNTEGCYFDYKHTDSKEEMGNLGVSTLTQVASFSPVSDSLDEQAKKKILGAQANLWTEQVTSSRQAEYLLFPRLFLLSQQLWNTLDDAKGLEKLPILYQMCEKLGLLCYKGPAT